MTVFEPCPGKLYVNRNGLYLVLRRYDVHSCVVTAVHVDVRTGETLVKDEHLWYGREVDLEGESSSSSDG